MVICFVCKSDTKALLDKLVASGQYLDHSDAITAAVANLAVLHSEMDHATSIVIGLDATAEQGNDQMRAADRVLGTEPSGSDHEKLSSQAQPQRTHAGRSAAVPSLFQLPDERVPPAQFAKIGPVPLGKSGIIPIDAWIFGQFNRLLPAKATCRALANIFINGGNQKPLEKLALDIASEAVGLGRYLTSVDERRKLGRDDAMAVAFPRFSPPDAFKSVQRFANQFVGSTTKDGRLLGLPAALKLIGPDPENAGGVALTEAGWKFGLMSNPLLDGLAAGKLEKFSDEEICFLTDHIVTSVPAEAFAYRTILKEVASGQLTPDSLDRTLAKLSKRGRKSGDPFVSTQRSGAISRMADIDLIARSRTATRVSYVITPRGKTFLQSEKS